MVNAHLKRNAETQTRMKRNIKEKGREGKMCVCVLWCVCVVEEGGLHRIHRIHRNNMIWGL